MFVFQGRISLERRSHYVAYHLSNFFWISANRGPANVEDENEKFVMYDFTFA